MTPARPDTAVVSRRLRALRTTLDDLGGLEGISADELRADRIRRAAAERLIQVAVDLAVEINAHLATSVLGDAPETARHSFTQAADIGAISPDLAEQLAPATGLRNVLVHQYVDIDIGMVETAIAQLLALLPRYLREVAGYVETLDPG